MRTLFAQNVKRKTCNISVTRKELSHLKWYGGVAQTCNPQLLFLMICHPYPDPHPANNQISCFLLLFSMESCRYMPTKKHPQSKPLFTTFGYIFSPSPQNFKRLPTCPPPLHITLNGVYQNVYEVFCKDILS